MAVYRITSPDGHTYRVTAPDDASRSEVLAFARANIDTDNPHRYNPVPRPEQPKRKIPTVVNPYTGKKHQPSSLAGLANARAMTRFPPTQLKEAIKSGRFEAVEDRERRMLGLPSVEDQNRRRTTAEQASENSGFQSFIDNAFAAQLATGMKAANLIGISTGKYGKTLKAQARADAQRHGISSTVGSLLGTAVDPAFLSAQIATDGAASALLGGAIKSGKLASLAKLATEGKGAKAYLARQAMAQAVTQPVAVGYGAITGGKEGAFEQGLFNLAFIPGVSAAGRFAADRAKAAANIIRPMAERLADTKSAKAAKRVIDDARDAYSEKFGAKSPARLSINASDHFHGSIDQLVKSIDRKKRPPTQGELLDKAKQFLMTDQGVDAWVKKRPQDAVELSKHVSPTRQQFPKELSDKLHFSAQERKEFAQRVRRQLTAHPGERESRQAAAPTQPTVEPTRASAGSPKEAGASLPAGEPDLSSMPLKDVKTEAKRRGIKVSNRRKADLTRDIELHRAQEDTPSGYPPEPKQYVPMPAYLKHMSHDELLEDAQRYGVKQTGSDEDIRRKIAEIRHPDVFVSNNGNAEARRRAWGAPGVDSPVRKSTAQLSEEAKAGGYTEEAVRTARSVVTTPRPLSDVEEVAMRDRLVSLTDERDRLLDAMRDEPDAATIMSLRADLTRTEEDATAILDATRTAGSEWARAGIARQMAYYKNLDRESLTARMTLARGKTISSKQSAAVKTLADKYIALKKRVNRANQTFNDQIADRALRATSGRKSLRQMTPAQRSAQLEDNRSRLVELLKKGCPVG